MTAAAIAAAMGPAVAAIAAAASSAAATERALVFDCQGERLLGILHPAAGDTGVVIIVGGPQYRAGSHRLFVHLARALAAAGHPVLRFDARGMGDSSGALRSFEHVTPDVGAAIDTLMTRQPQLRRVVLCGLCDAASGALLYLHERQDARVAGLCLLNPWVRSAASHASTRIRHYYRRRLMQREFWAKLLSGQVAPGAWRELMGHLRLSSQVKVTSARPDGSAGFQDRMLAGWCGFGGATLLVLSGHDYTAREFEEFCRTSTAWQAVLQAAPVSRVTLADANHTLSGSAAQDQLIQHLIGWLASSVASPPTAAQR